MKKRIRDMCVFVLVGIAVTITVDLIDFYVFNESYVMPTETINSTSYSRICFDNENIDVVDLEFHDEEVLWMSDMLKEKVFKTPLFEKKGKLPMRQYIVGLSEDDKSIYIHIYDDGKASLISTSRNSFKLNVIVAYLNKSEMDYLRTIVGP